MEVDGVVEMDGVEVAEVAEIEIEVEAEVLSTLKLQKKWQRERIRACVRCRCSKLVLDAQRWTIRRL